MCNTVFHFAKCIARSNNYKAEFYLENLYQLYDLYQHGLHETHMAKNIKICIHDINHSQVDVCKFYIYNVTVTYFSHCDAGVLDFPMQSIFGLAGSITYCRHQYDHRGILQAITWHSQIVWHWAETKWPPVCKQRLKSCNCCAWFESHSTYDMLMIAWYIFRRVCV